MNVTDMIGALLCAILAGTGVGGGGLFVIYLTVIKNTPQVSAQALNLVFFISAALAALPYHLKRRHVNVKLILICASLGIIGTLLGGVCRQKLPERLLRRLFGGGLILVGLRSFFRKKGGKNALSPPPETK